MNMKTKSNQNATSYVDLKTSINGWTLLSALIKSLFVLSLFVLVGYIYINLNKQNRDLQLQLTEMTKRHQDSSLIKQNIDNMLLQKANEIDKESKLKEFGLVELDKTQIVVLDAPDYDSIYLPENKTKQKLAQYQSKSQYPARFLH